MCTKQVRHEVLPSQAKRWALTMWAVAEQEEVDPTSECDEDSNGDDDSQDEEGDGNPSVNKRQRVRSSSIEPKTEITL